MSRWTGFSLSDNRTQKQPPWAAVFVRVRENWGPLGIELERHVFLGFVAVEDFSCPLDELAQREGKRHDVVGVCGEIDHALHREGRRAHEAGIKGIEVEDDFGHQAHGAHLSIEVDEDEDVVVEMCESLGMFLDCRSEPIANAVGREVCHGTFSLKPSATDSTGLADEERDFVGDGFGFAERVDGDRASRWDRHVEFARLAVFLGSLSVFEGDSAAADTGFDVGTVHVLVVLGKPPFARWQLRKPPVHFLFGFLRLTKHETPINGQCLENDVEALVVFVFERGADLQPERFFPLSAIIDRVDIEGRPCRGFLFSLWRLFRHVSYSSVTALFILRKTGNSQIGLEHSSSSKHHPAFSPLAQPVICLNRAHIDPSQRLSFSFLPAVFESVPRPFQGTDTSAGSVDRVSF